MKTKNEYIDPVRDDHGCYIGVDSTHQLLNDKNEVVVNINVQIRAYGALRQRDKFYSELTHLLEKYGRILEDRGCDTHQRYPEFRREHGSQV